MSQPDVADRPAKAPVIQLIRGAELSAGERILHRILPACVASAGLHLLLAGGVGLYAWINPTVEAKPAVEEVAVAVEERPDAPEPDNLTDPNVSLDDAVAVTALDTTDKLDTRTIETTVLDPEPAGNPDGTLKSPIDSLLAAGSDNPNMVPGLDQGLAPGSIGGGQGGLAIANDSFKGRGASTTRDALAKAFGGNKESEAAVGRGLAWLAHVQKKEGTVGYWEYDGTDSKDRISATGLALLPFLAAGQTHKPGKDNLYRDHVNRGLDFLLKQQKADGSFSTGSYSHAIATVAVCEAFGMTSDKTKLLRAAQAAIDFIQKGQAPNGSWGYNLTIPDEGDTSIVGWQIQALHSAKMCKDLKVSQAVLTKAMKFLDSVASGATKSMYGYKRAGDPTPTRTAIGLLCRYYLNGWGPNHPGLRDGVAYLMRTHPPTAEKGYDMYYYYYATQIIHFHEGDAWSKDWNPKMRDFLLAKQRKDTGKVELDGSWDKDSSPWMGSHCGRLGTSCMALLTLEVYYRHLPLYGRGTGGKTDLEMK
jgi:hypothetical protein